MTFFMSIVAPGFDRPAAEHEAYQKARDCWHREKAAAAEIASLSETIRASDPRIRELQIREAKLEEATNDAVVEYLDAIRDTRETRPEPKTAA